ncbi:MAG: NAD(P)H-binding protein, partial [Desulfobacterales bacterium]|nr:NAD(P)H-binding protein [Desulfobacterales bacterium]
MSKSKIKVCIIGASGFVGRALVERLLTRDGSEIKAVIRSPGNAWSILRHDLDVIQADVLNIDSLREAVKGSTHVVNLSLGSYNEMAAGISNIIKVCNEFEVERLVHLSSITVYG